MREWVDSRAEDGAPEGVEAEPANWERPRERLAAVGVEALSPVELVALILRTGTRGRSASDLASELLESFGSLERLACAGHAELAAFGGLGPAKIASLRASIELGTRSARIPLRPGQRFREPEQVFSHLAPRLVALRQERFLALLLDSRHRLISEVEVSRGSLDRSLVHPREVFGPALRESAAAMIVVHNHPSGDPEPSREDREVTARLVRGAEILGIALLDHITVARGGFVSFASRGWLVPQVTPEARR